MRNDTIQLPQAGNTIADEPLADRSSYFSQLVRITLGLFTSVKGRSSRAYQSDGLEALDMLGGWQGSDPRRRRDKG